ncbi:MAG: hypothetical protein AAB875_02050 [Patescibacteria group bacterium]
MEKSPFQFFRKTTKNKDETPANFSLQCGKIEKDSKGFHTEDEALKYLAKILVGAYFKQKKYEREKQLQ